MHADWLNLMDEITFEIQIRYCAVCNYEPHALALLERVMKYKMAISKMVMVPVGMGIFEVWMDGECIASKSDVDDFPSPEDVLASIRRKRGSMIE